MQILRMGTCCTHARPLRPPPLSLAPFRSLSSFPRYTPLVHAATLPSRHPTGTQSRLLSLASLFRRPVAFPEPAVAAKIAKLEAEADAHPNDVEKQLALFEALVATKAKPALDTVVARWERLCEFVSSSFMVTLFVNSIHAESYTSVHSVGLGLQILPGRIAWIRTGFVHQCCCSPAGFSLGCFVYCCICIQRCPPSY